ncbi:hypothetical protein RJT34_15879 [Clitoria ternatea]|uniref:RING-type domain-containing protein n=1 Tax=Clitoria ternatea TaxID=43366 RepID=A0AAN9J977_CLITE
MQNSPTVIAAPPPRLLPPPLSTTSPITVIPLLPPPPPFAGAPNSVFQITVLPTPLPPAGDSSSFDLSPLEFLLALVAIITIPALIYTFIFSFRCPSSSRREHETGDASVVSEISHHDVESAVAVAASGVKYKKEAHAKEIGGECPVCLSVFADGEEVRQLSACKHSFHASCINMWLSNHSNCPICRATTTATTTVKHDGDPPQGHRERDTSNLV